LVQKHLQEIKPDSSVFVEDGIFKNGSGMMPDSESQTCLEAARQMTIISPKAIIATNWNQ
jgi:hypothetical protein